MSGMRLFGIEHGAAALFEWLLKGGLECDLAQLDLKAAAAGMRKARLDGRHDGQLWVVIGHLEAAEIKLESAVAAHFLQEYGRPLSYKADVYDLFKARLLQAPCYAYLKRKNTAAYMCDKAEECYKFGDSNRTLRLSLLTIEVAALLALKDAVTDKRVRFRHKDGPPSKFAETLSPHVTHVRAAIADGEFEQEAWFEQEPTGFKFT